MGINKIIVLDFGGQYTHLLARRIRELGVYSEIKAPTVSSEELHDAKGIILSGGPQSVYDEDAIAFNPELFEVGIPILGLCYGQQLIAHELNGKVEKGKVKEFGSANLKAGNNVLFNGLPKEFTVWMSHGDTVESLPKGFENIGETEDCANAAIMNEEKQIYGLQFHPEVSHTQNGLKILSNFVFDVCGAHQNWTMENFLAEKIDEIQKETGDKNVFLLMSGGVDSTVALVLLDKALGSDRIHALHVDNGFLRKNESETVVRELENLGLGEIHLVDASKEFLEKLEGIVEPEEKRNIIGQYFVDLALEELDNLNFETDTWLIGQGTIYPDTIETGGTQNAKKIKTHHNRAPIIMEMMKEGRVIEPLKELYKDEVRQLGKILGIPEKLLNRHPFPGPGLAIRALCSDGSEKADKKLEKKVNEKLAKTEYNARVLPIKAVGVQGDNRTYRNAVVLEGPINYDKLEKISTLITNSFDEINRVVFLLYPMQATSIELEKAYLTKERLDKLREADAIIMGIVEEKKMQKEVWQFPVVLLPLNFNSKGEGIVLRPVYSREAMTAKFARLGPGVIEEIVEKVSKIKGIGAIMLDVTHKPPATIEWE
ncbi:MAG TPA: glutamine-hydrolyzing GMP synthase [archaeon]|nr:glutamine-hydrolyzing GMP synthase [archaeon]